MKKLERSQLNGIRGFSLNNNKIFVSGNTEILKKRKIAIFTSQKIPLSIIPAAEEFMLTLVRTPYVFISGWHSSFERIIFKELTKRKKEVVLFTSKGIKNFKLLSYMRDPYQENRLLIGSILREKDKVTLNNSLKRNKVVSEIADYNLFIFINKGGNLEKLFFELVDQRKIPLIFGHPTNFDFFEKGEVIGKSNLVEILK